MALVPIGLCQCGCGERTSLSKHTNTARGLIKGQPVRYLPGHNMGGRRGFVIDPGSGCWNYAGTLTKEGRAGVLYRGGRYISAYVFYYERSKGAIGLGLVLDHTCRNPRCVNPDHLEPVTQAVNTRRGRRVKLTKSIAVEIRALKGIERPCDIARRYGISQSLVSGILHNRKWRDVEAPHLRGAA